MHFGSKEEETAIKYYIISLLVKQAQSEGNFNNIEKKYLAYVTRSLRLSDAEVAAVRHTPDDFDIISPSDEGQRATILYYLLFMMKADQKINEEEEKLCYEVGFRMGFRQEMITNLIHLMQQYLTEDIPPDGMIEKIKPYLN